MAITLDQIVEEASHLPPDVVAELVDRILVACRGGIDPSVEAAWKSEIDLRIADVESGKVNGIPVEESLARMRKLAGG